MSPKLVIVSIKSARKEDKSAVCSGVFAVFFENNKIPVLFVNNFPKILKYPSLLIPYIRIKKLILLGQQKF